MILFLIFILLLMAENLFLPALIGSGSFFIMPIFLIATFIYRKNTRIWIFQAGIMLSVLIFFSKISPQDIIIPMALASSLYIILIKFLNINEDFKTDMSAPALIASAALLMLLTLFYSATYIIVNSPLDPLTVWAKLKTSTISSIVSLAGWSLAISAAFKFYNFSK